jgi:hypothetical protein
MLATKRVIGEWPFPVRPANSLPPDKNFPAPAKSIPCPAAQGIECNTSELLHELTSANTDSDRKFVNSLRNSLPQGTRATGGLLAQAARL